MDAVSFMQSDVKAQGTVCNVLRASSDDSYGSDTTSTVDTLTVAIYAAQSSSQMVPAGMAEDTAFSGLVVPERDENDDVVTVTKVGDVLQPQTNTAQRYTVETKDGLPNDIDPKLWILGLSRGNN